MRFNRMKIIAICLSLLLASAAANAFNYMDWVPLLPENIGGLEKTGETEGMDKNEGDRSWSVIKQKYSDAEGNTINFSILTGSNAPGIKEFKMMQQINMETDKKAVKTVDVSGRKSVLTMDKTGDENTLLIPAADNTLVIISTDAFNSEKEMISLADDVSVEDIADSVE
ncbi:MAG: hypothetical protein K9J85_07985 [Desulfobacteraceae bacterium]|nr:hypothetical protein [Desulfobacteraceae bacterium]